MIINSIEPQEKTALQAYNIFEKGEGNPLPSETLESLNNIDFNLKIYFLKHLNFENFENLTFLNSIKEEINNLKDDNLKNKLLRDVENNVKTEGSRFSISFEQIIENMKKGLQQEIEKGNHPKRFYMFEVLDDNGKPRILGKNSLVNIENTTNVVDPNSFRAGVNLTLQEPNNSNILSFPTYRDQDGKVKIPTFLVGDYAPMTASTTIVNSFENILNRLNNNKRTDRDLKSIETFLVNTRMSDERKLAKLKYEGSGFALEAFKNLRQNQVNQNPIYDEFWKKYGFRTNEKGISNVTNEQKNIENQHVIENQNIIVKQLYKYQIPFNNLNIETFKALIKNPFYEKYIDIKSGEFNMDEDKFKKLFILEKYDFSMKTQKQENTLKNNFSNLEPEELEKFLTQSNKELFIDDINNKIKPQNNEMKYDSVSLS